MELSEIQRVISVGPYVTSGNANIPTFGVDDWVKVNFNRFVKPKVRKSVKDGNSFDTSDLEFYIPLATFNNEDYLLIDQGDVEYWWDKTVTE